MYKQIIEEYVETEAWRRDSQSIVIALTLDDILIIFDFSEE